MAFKLWDTGDTTSEMLYKKYTSDNGHLPNYSPTTCHGGAWQERRYNSYSFMTSALDGGEWSVS
jgi:hypothetical protein